jgi:hypothetical protein
LLRMFEAGGGCEERSAMGIYQHASP